MSKDDRLARGFTIQRGHPLDIISRRRAAVEQFSNKQWKYCPLGAPEFQQYPESPPPPSFPPNISGVTVARFFTSIIISYTVYDGVEVQSAYVELLDNNYTLIELKQAKDIPSSAVEYSGVLEFLNLTPGSYIVKFS